MQDKQYSLTQKYNLLKNSVSLSLPLFMATFISAVIGGIGSLFSYFYIFTSQLPVSPKYIQLYFSSIISFDDLIKFEGKEYSKDIILEKMAIKMGELFDYSLIVFTIGFFVFGTIAFILIRKFANKHTEKNLHDQHIRGSQIINEDELTKRQTEKKVNGYLVTPKIKINRDTETMHMLIAGSSGSGKTVFIKREYRSQKNHQLNQAAKWIIHDVKGDFVRQLYNPETDLIFNMSDERSLNFNIFNYINDEMSLESVIATIIPRSAEEKEPIWTDSARGILSGILMYCLTTNQKNIKKVKELMNLKPNLLKKKLLKVQGAEAAIAYLSAGESQVANYMSNFQSKVKYFSTISDCHDDKESFDIEKWLNKDYQSTIFMVNDVANADINAIRIAVFVESLVKIVLSMVESKERRIFLTLDELGAAAKMDKLVSALQLGRSFGLKVTIGIQEIARIDSIYGADTRKTIVNNMQSKVFLRAGEAETAKALSETIGEKEIEQSSSSASIGLESNRDGVGFSKAVKKEFLVLPSEILGLEDLEYFLKQPSEDWARIQAKYNPEIDTLENKHEAFIKCSSIKSFDEIFNNQVDIDVDIEKSKEELKEEDSIQEEEKEEQDEKSVPIEEESDPYTFG